jgi:hypothetical protein
VSDSPARLPKILSQTTLSDASSATTPIFDAKSLRDLAWQALS